VPFFWASFLRAYQMASREKWAMKEMGWKGSGLITAAGELH